MWKYVFVEHFLSFSGLSDSNPLFYDSNPIWRDLNLKIQKCMNAPKNARKSSTNIHVHTSYKFISKKGSIIMNVHTSFTSIMPNYLLSLQNWSSFKGLVKISTSWLRVSTCSMQMSPLSAWTLIKLCIISLCLVRECWTKFLVMFMALVLSQKIWMLCKVAPKSLNCCLIHKIWAQQLPTIIYSASIVERATKFYFLLDQDTSIWSRNWHIPLVLFLLVLLLV